MAPPEAPPPSASEAGAGGGAAPGDFALGLDDAEVALLPPNAEGSVAKVAQFLRNIRGLSILPGHDLDALLYDNRFELLPEAPGDASASGRGPSRGQAGSKLPLHSEIPTQRELHDVLTGGTMAGSHQCVAHVLYPDSVRWPYMRNTGIVESLASKQPEGDGTPESDAPPKGGDSSEAGFQRPSFSSSTSGLQRQDTGTFSDDGSPKPRKHVPSLVTAPESSAGDGHEDQGAEVVLCGRKVKTTALGRRLHDHSEEGPSPQEVEAEREFKAARIRRQKIERATKLECYGEQKLLERIQALEAMKRAELQHQAELQKREAKRQARQEELRKQLSADVSRKMEEEKAQQEAEAEQKKKDALAEQRSKRYHAKQKDALDQWYAESCDDYLSRGAQAKLRCAEIEGQRKVQESVRQGQQKTVRQLEAMQKIHRIQVATEERPPLPPKPHDLPRPVLEVLDGASDGPSSARSGPPSARSGPPTAGSWAVQARAVSSMYGLSDKEKAAIKDQLSRTIRGAGRMAAYEK